MINISETDAAKLSAATPKNNQLGNYLSGISGMIAPVTTDIKGVYDEYNQKIQTPLEQNFNVANYNELANLGPTYMDMSGYKKMSGKDIFIDSQFVGAAEGAAAGMSLGPWGALAGAISGNAMHLWKDLAHNNVGYKDYLQQVNSFNTRQLQNYNNNISNAYDKLNYDYMKNQKVNYAAFGGNLFTQNQGPFTEIKSGGSHEENPYGGIPQGIGSNGKQNLVEQGEVKYNDFIFSKRVYPTKEILGQFKIPIKYFGLSTADIAKKLNLEAKERISDPISNTGQDAMLRRLQQAQEMQKISNEAAKNNMSVEEYMSAMQQQPQEQQNQFATGGNLDIDKDPPLTPVDGTRVQTQQLDYKLIQQNEQAAQQQQIVEEFIKEYIAQTAYIGTEQIKQFNSTLTPAELSIVNSMSQDVLENARANYLDKKIGTITQGRDYNAVQEWWRDFTQTAKGQEIVKFINDPIINMMTMPLSGGAALSLMGAGWADQYGQGASANEVGKQAALDIGTMLIMGRILGGKQDLNKLGISTNYAPPKIPAQTKGNFIEPTKTPIQTGSTPRPKVEVNVTPTTNPPVPTKTVKSTWKQQPMGDEIFNNKYRRRIANTATFAIPSFIGLGLGTEYRRDENKRNWEYETKLNRLQTLEKEIYDANTSGDLPRLQRAVANWQQTVKDYGFTDYAVSIGSPAYDVLKEAGALDNYNKPVGIFNNTQTQQQMNTTNTQGAFIPPILKNHKVVKVEDGVTTFDNGVQVFKTNNGKEYVLEHTISKGTRQVVFNNKNEQISDKWYDKNNKYLGDHDDVVKSWDSPTSTQTTTKQQNTTNSTSGGEQSYSGGTPKYSNYTPIDYSSEEGKKYMERYNSVGKDWNRLHEDWKKANPTSTYSLEQFKALAHDNKYGLVHKFINGYNTTTQQSTPQEESLNITTDIPFIEDIPSEFNYNVQDQKTVSTDSQTNNWDKWREAAMFFNPARLAPIFNDIYNLSNQEGADPTLANSIRGAYIPTQAEQFGQAMAFTPFDWRANEIAQRAKAQSAQRAMMNIAGGNTAAATANLALQNAINQGDIAANYRQGIEYNNAQLAAALGFNNQLDQANAMNRQQVNQANNANYMNSLVNSAQIWDQEKKLIEQTRGQNQNMLAQNLGGLGQDYVNYNMINSNPAFLYSVMNSYKGNK